MRLVAQGLVGPMDSVLAAARLLTCAQGQDYPGSMLSLALRTSGRSLEAVRAAYDQGQIVRSWPVRGTLFVVAAEDLGWIRDLSAEKLIGATGKRRKQLGLTPPVLRRAEQVAVEALQGGGLTRPRLLRRWEQEGLQVGQGSGYHLLSYLALRGLVCQGPTEGAEQRFVLVDEWIRAPRRLERDQAVRELLRRYVEARGPVPLEDFCWWSKLGKVEARAALADVRDELAVADVEGREHWLAADLPDRYASQTRATAAPLLVPGFDEVVLGYGDRRAVLSKAEEALVVPGGNGVFKATVLHRGRAVGTWRRPTRQGAPVRVQPFGTLPAAVSRALPRLTAGLPGVGSDRSVAQ